MAKKLSQIPALAAVAGGNRIQFDSLVGQEITIYGAEWKDGEKGDYAVITFTAAGSKEKQETQSGAEQVVAILKAADENDSYPFVCTPEKFASKKYKGKFAYSLA